MRIRKAAPLGILALASAWTHAPALPPGAVLVRTSTMLGSDTEPTNRQKLSVAVSSDGTQWKRLFKTPTLTNFSRDASITRHGDEYVVVSTDAFNSTNATFGFARSTNLVHWAATNVTLTGPAMANTPNNTWAPEWFVDGERYYVLVRSTQQSAHFTTYPNYAPPGIGWLECLDPGIWTNWTDFTPLADLEPTYENDPFIIKVGHTYHLFTDHFNYPGGPAILHRKSTEGPFSGYGPPVNIATNFANAPAYVSSGLNRSSPWEGQFVLPLGGDRYRLYFQAMWHDASFCIESLNGMESWDTGTMQWLTYDGLPAYGHGSVLLIPNDDFLVPAITAAKLPDNSVVDVQTTLSIYTDSLLQTNRLAGQDDVLRSPTSFGLYTPESITDLNLGGVMIEKTDNIATISLQLQATTNLLVPFTNHGAPIPLSVELPGDKHFLRIRALGPQ
jgi:hypothetical protein